MAWKSFYLSAGMVATIAVPLYEGVSGKANIPDGPCIVVANHSSFLDGPLLAWAYCQARLKPLHMIAYEEPFHNWLMGWILRSGGCIPFRRGNRQSQAKMLRTALGWLAAGEAVGIFPEGHINQKTRLNRPRPGAALLALETGLPIIPAAIFGSSAMLPIDKTFPRLTKPRIKIAFGRQIPFLEKEMRYQHLPRDERQMLVKNLGIRIIRAIGKMTGRETPA